LELLHDGVRVEALCTSGQEQIRPFEVLGRFVADTSEKRLGVLGPSLGWNVFLQLLSVLSRRIEVDFTHAGPLGQGNYLVPYEFFRQIHLILPSVRLAGFDQKPIFKADGRVVEPEKLKPSYRLTIDTSAVSQPRIIAECLAGDAGTFPPSPVFDFFLTLDRGRGPGPLKTQARRTVMYEAFFRLSQVGNQSDGKKLIRQALAGSDISRFRYRREAAELLQMSLDRFLLKEERLAAGSRQWFRVPCDKQSEALLYQIPYLCFGPQVFNGLNAYNMLTLSDSLLDRQLSSLHAQLQKHDIELFVDRKRVVAGRWDFSFDATTMSCIDWFEIKPEIRCNGTLLSQEEWLQVLNGSGLQDDGDEIRLLDTASREVLRSVATVLQTSRDQERQKREIVQVQRLQILDWISLRRHGVTVKLPPEEEALVERLTNFQRIEPLPVPKRLDAEPRPYQRDGYHWLAFLYQHRLGACLADDMGLGKTLQAIMLIGAIQERILAPRTSQNLGPHLLVLPPSLLFNWESELKRFYPGLKLGFYTGKERTTNFEGCDVAMATYAVVRRDIEKLKEITFHVIIFDEAQAIKNIFANTTGATRQLRGYFKLALTGTPLENHLGEYFSILDLCLPGLMGDYRQFKARLKLDSSQATDLVMRRTRPFVLRRAKEKILKELPPKTESDVYLELTEKQKILYQETVSQVRLSVEEAYRHKTRSQAQIIALTAILKLRQLCVSPRLVDPKSVERSPKIEFLIGKLKELREEGHGALVFSQFTSFLDLLEEDLNTSRMLYSRMDGSTAVKTRKHLVERFQKGNAPLIFLLSLKVGGQGLNLTRASYVFHLDPWWNPAVENQASDRAHRIGQTCSVSITRILMRHTIEEKMMELKKRKLALYRAVMEGSTAGTRGSTISKEDFDFLVSG
jgi:non-specific serine/threonine protein kinase